MTYHILNGDALIKTFLDTGLNGEMVIARECLIEGDLGGETLTEFYKTRAKHIATTYDETEENYMARVVSEHEKLKDAPDDSEFNLWFGTICFVKQTCRLYFLSYTTYKFRNIFL